MKNKEINFQQPDYTIEKNITASFKTPKPSAENRDRFVKFIEPLNFITTFSRKPDSAHIYYATGQISLEGTETLPTLKEKLKRVAMGLGANTIVNYKEEYVYITRYRTTVKISKVTGMPAIAYHKQECSSEEARANVKTYIQKKNDFVKEYRAYLKKCKKEFWIQKFQHYLALTLFFGGLYYLLVGMHS